jgi:hypothetical protein
MRGGLRFQWLNTQMVVAVFVLILLALGLVRFGPVLVDLIERR